VYEYAAAPKHDIDDPEHEYPLHERLDPVQP
jgi:hypothetical protein